MPEPDDGAVIEAPEAATDTPADLAHSAEPDEGPEPIPLICPVEGVPPLCISADEIAAAAEQLAAGTGPFAVDAERASGFRYSNRAYLIQIRRTGAGTVLIDPVNHGGSSLDALAPVAQVEGEGHSSPVVTHEVEHGLRPGGDRAVVDLDPLDPGGETGDLRWVDRPALAVCQEAPDER